MEKYNNQDFYNIFEYNYCYNLVYNRYFMTIFMNIPKNTPIGDVQEFVDQYYKKLFYIDIKNNKFEAIEIIFINNQFK